MAYHKLGWLVKRLDCSVVVEVRSQEMFKIPVIVHLDDISSTAELLEPTLVWWCIIMRQSVMQEDRFVIFKVKVIVRAHIIKCDCFHHIYWTADLFATNFNWMIHDRKLEYLLKNWIVEFKVKVTVKVQNLIEFLCILYLLCHWPLGNQIGCADILLLKNKPSTTEWACTDSNTGLSVTSHAPGGGV